MENPAGRASCFQPSRSYHEPCTHILFHSSLPPSLLQRCPGFCVRREHHVRLFRRHFFGPLPFGWKQQQQAEHVCGRDLCLDAESAYARSRHLRGFTGHPMGQGEPSTPSLPTLIFSSLLSNLCPLVVGKACLSTLSPPANVFVISPSW